MFAGCVNMFATFILNPVKFPWKQIIFEIAPRQPKPGTAGPVIPVSVPQNEAENVREQVKLPAI